MTPSRKLLVPAILIILLAAIVASTGSVDPTKYDPCNPQQPPCGVKTSTLYDTGSMMPSDNWHHLWTNGYVDSDGVKYSPTSTEHMEVIDRIATFRYSLNSAGEFQIDEIVSIETPCPTNPCCQPTPCTTHCCNCITPQPTPTPCKTPVGYTTYNNGTKVPVWGE